MNICNSEKFIYSKGYIILPIDLPKELLPKKIILEENELIIKTTFHVSLVSIKNLLEKFDIENFEEKILKLFCEFEKENPISFNNFTGVCRYAERERDDRKSLVAMCSIYNLDNFFQKLREEFTIEIDTQPTHVSLYTLKLDEAIGINGVSSLESLTKVIENQNCRDIMKILQK